MLFVPSGIAPQNKTACRTLFSVQNAAGGFKSTLGQGRGEERHIYPTCFVLNFDLKNGQI